jgi:hypothetical protein
MITVFSAPKPFIGHFAVIQRNAIRSWKLLHPDVEVILFGNEQGTAEVAREMKIRHEPQIARTEFGTPLLNDMFRRAQEIARHEWLCYSNADIIQTQQFRSALDRARAWGPALVVGRRWDLDIVEPLDFSAHQWGELLSRQALESGKQQGYEWIDYFAFPTGLCREMPAFAVGRAAWDNWMIWNLRRSGVAVLDISPAVMAIHQNHGYPPQVAGADGPWPAEESARNRALAGGPRHHNTIADATHVMQVDAIRRTYWHMVIQAKREWHGLFNPLWFWFLDFSRPLRHRMGLRQRKGAAKNF